jgi:cob(I)alamin adenosyltransferase
MTGKTEPLLEDPRPTELAEVSSLVVLHTGDGKGKTTAAIGTAVRARGHGWDVAVFQFIKSSDWRTGEAKSCADLGIRFESLGDGFTWDSSNIENDIALARNGWATVAAEISAGKYQLIVLDELTYLCTWGWVEVSAVVSAISKRPPHVNIVITGRDACEELVSLADTASKSVNLHHAYDRGIAALKGIDF